MSLSSSARIWPPQKWNRLIVAIVAFTFGVSATLLGVLLFRSDDIIVLPTKGKPLENWHAGDVHTHAVGDAPLLNHPACERDQADPLVGEACARHVVALMLRAADRNGLEWLILSEHGPWLGVRDLAHITDYDPQKGRAEWRLIRDAANAESVVFGIRALMGEELGSAPPFSSSGHFNAYQIDDYVENDTRAVADAVYIREVAEAGGWGGINHPFLGANTWDCWFPTSSWVSELIFRHLCAVGASEFAETPFAEEDDSRGAFAAMEVLNGRSFPLPGVLDQWDQLLQQGYRVWGVGGSDAHVLSRGFDSWKHGVEGRLGGEVFVGSSQTFVYVPKDRYAAPTDGYDSTDPSDPIREGIQLGRTVASNGGFATAQVVDALPGGSIQVPEGEVRVEVSVTWQRDFTPGGDSPTSIRIVLSQYGPQCAEFACEMIVRTECLAEPCIAGSELLQASELDGTHDSAVIPVTLPADWVRAYVRVEVLGAPNEGAPTIGAFVSPIYLVR